jgi:hypothetical protein
MRVELVREQPNESGAVRGRDYVDGVFFSYSLENSAYIFPNGVYSLYGKKSPKFNANKVYIDVPGRSNIMFHGGNTVKDTTGCVLVASERNGETVNGDQSGYLFDVVDMAAKNGEPVGLIVRNDRTKIFIALGIVTAIGFYFYSKKGR